MKLMRFNLEKFSNPFKNDPFLKTSVVWGLAILAMIMVLQFAQLQLFSTYDSRVAALVPFLLLLFGAAYMVKFIGARPVFYTAICGLTVGVGLAFLGLLEELLSFQGIYFESFARFLLVAVVRGAGMMVVGGLAGWIMTRGRVPIAIELPSKKEEDEARRSGQPLPGPRIVTPVSAMPGNPETNAALMEQLEKDPTSLMSEHQRRKVTPPVEDRPPVSARNGKRKTR